MPGYRDIVPAVVGYILLYGALSYLVNEFVLDDSFFMTEWGDLLGARDVDRALEQKGKWVLIGYAFIPVSVAAKILFPSMCLAVGCAIAGWKFSFTGLVYVAVRAELVLAIGAVLHAVCMIFVIDIGSMFEYATFYPLSVLNLVTLDAESGWMVYAFRTMNVFEVAYILMLGIEIRKSLHKDVRSCLLVASVSYGVGLMLLVSVVTFAMLYVS